MPRTQPGGGERRDETARVAWREVSLERFGREPAAHFYRGAAFVVWVHPANVCGIFATAPQTSADLDEAWSAWAALARARRAPLAHLCDARAFRAESAPHLLYGKLLFEGLRRAEQLRATYSRVAVVLPTDWTSAWWAGAMAQWAPTPIRTMSSVDPARQWLDMPDHVAVAVGDLTSSFESRSSLPTKARALLRGDPSLDLVDVAARLGTSARSIQRVLARSGESFAALRTRVRLEVATEQLLSTDDKVESVGSAIGFRSRAHFLRWFREHVGDTPTGFRRGRAPARGPA